MNEKVRFKSEPFKYIPKEYLIYIKENAELVEQEVIETETWGPINGYQALLSGLFEVRQDYQYPISTVVLAQMFLACTSDEAAEKLQVTPHLYEYSDAVDVFIWVADNNNIDAYGYFDKAYVRVEDEKQAHSILDPYVDFILWPEVVDGGKQVVFKDRRFE